MEKNKTSLLLRNKKALSLLGLFIFAFALILVLKSDKFPFFGQKLAVVCPVPKEFCKKGVVLKKDGRVIGLGFMLPPTTPLLTATSGNLEEGSQGGGPFNVRFHPLLFLHGEKELQGYIITYSFYGTSIFDYQQKKKNTVFEAGQSVANIGPGNFPKQEPYNGVNFIFSIQKGGKTAPPLPLSAFEFK